MKVRISIAAIVAAFALGACTPVISGGASCSESKVSGGQNWGASSVECAP